MKVHVLNHMVHDIVVHRVGCRDIERERSRRQLNSDWVVEVPDGDDIAEAVAADLSASFGWPENYDEGEEAPWRPDHIRVMPCVRRGK